MDTGNGAKTVDWVAFSFGHEGNRLESTYPDTIEGREFARACAVWSRLAEECANGELANLVEECRWAAESLLEAMDEDPAMRGKQTCGQIAERVDTNAYIWLTTIVDDRTGQIRHEIERATREGKTCFFEFGFVGSAHMAHSVSNTMLDDASAFEAWAFDTLRVCNEATAEPLKRFTHLFREAAVRARDAVYPATRMGDGLFDARREFFAQ